MIGSPYWNILFRTPPSSSPTSSIPFLFRRHERCTQKQKFRKFYSFLELRQAHFAAMRDYWKTEMTPLAQMQRKNSPMKPGKKSEHEEFPVNGVPVVGASDAAAQCSRVVTEGVRARDLNYNKCAGSAHPWAWPKP